MNFEIIGEVADLGCLPSGCAFHPRCQQCFAPCQQHRPELKPTIGEAAGRTGDHLVACHLNDEACPQWTQ
jgi:ABC-type dipeptide/oligopeptide/nickel transport system ATPase component